MIGGIFFLIIAIILIGICIIEFKMDNGEGGFLCILLMLLCFILSYSCFEEKFGDKSKTIKCREIQQIDTLYKNDSIIGYEIKYEERTK